MKSLWMLLLAVVAVSQASKMREMFYSFLDSSDFSCTRLMDAERQIGCSSPEGGAVGVLFLIESTADLNLFKTAPRDAYIALISQKMFTPDTVKELFKHEHFKGAYVFDDGFGQVSGNKFSVDDVFPNSKHGLPFSGTNVSWNSVGGGFGDSDLDGMHWQDFTHYPIYYIKDADKDMILARYNETNRIVNNEYPKGENLLGADLDNFMFGVKNAEICLRRDQCDPLGGFNLYATLAPFDDAKKTIVVAAQVDSLALFHERSFGANADVSGVVTLIAAAQLLGDPLNNAVRGAGVKNIMFVLFDGESFGYIGSSKIGRDIYNVSSFPTENDALRFQDIDAYIEVNQLLTGTTALHSFVHEDNAAGKAVSDALTAAIGKVSTDMNTPLSLSSVNGVQLPPASLRSLLYEMRDNTLSDVFPGVVVTDHDGTGFTNNFYHSRFDTIDNINGGSQAKINQTVALASALARTVWALAAGVDPTTLAMPAATADAGLIGDLFTCITQNATCDLARNLIGSYSVRAEPMGLYVGVNSDALKIPKAFMFSALARAVAIDRNVSSLYDNRNCKSGNNPPSFQLLALASGECVNATAYIHRALSPAFSGSKLLPVGTGPAYFDGRDPRWSTWTESRWDSVSSRVFLISSYESQRNTLIGASLWLVFSFVVVFLLSSRLTQAPSRLAQE